MLAGEVSRLRRDILRAPRRGGSLFRIWAFLAGLPLGLLLAMSFASALAAWLFLCLAGGFVLLLVVSLAARGAGHAVDRRRHLAEAASLALLAWPAAGCAWLGFRPGAVASLLLVAAIVAAGTVRARRLLGPGGGVAYQLRFAMGVLAIGALLFAALAGLLGAWGAPELPEAVPAQRAHYLFDLDARVATRPLPRCDSSAQRADILVAGARPALELGAPVLWFDAPGPEGRRQIHRLDLVSAEVGCATCAEAGNNLAPKPVRGGGRVVFETDRHRSHQDPVSREIYLTRGGASSRRLTFFAGPNRRGMLDPGGRGLLWSSGNGGRWDLVTASLQTGHGGMLLSSPVYFEPGGVGPIEALAWSPDARSVVLRDGNSSALGASAVLDPATGERVVLDPGGARVVAASFSADGGTLAVAATRQAASSAALGRSLGFLIARIELLGPETPTLHRGTEIWLGPRAEQLEPVDLGSHAGWGSPSGIALRPEGDGFFLGQWRSGRAGVEERILEVALGCE
jgi:hypothetical protein